MKQISKKIITREDFLHAYCSTTLSPPITLTANQRQARFLIGLVSEHHPSALAKPSILSVQQWVDQLWQLHEDQCGNKSDYELIDSIEERSLWRGIISNSTELPTLIDSESLVDKIMGAADLIVAHAVPLEDLERFASTETHFFISVFKEFNTLCEERRFICKRQLPNLLRDNDHINSVFKNIDVYGFVDIAPNIQNLLEYCSNSVNQLNFENDYHRETPRILEFKESDEELNAIAAWCKKHIENNKDESVAVVIPQLSALKSKIDYIFMQYLEPHRFYDLSVRPFSELYDISAGDKLGSTYLLDSLFCVFELRKSTISKETAKQLCFSPFFVPAIDDASMRTLQWLEENVASQVRVSTFLSVMQSHAGQQSEDKITANSETDYSITTRAINFLSLRQTFRTDSKMRSNRQWCDWLVNQLELIGWPGERSLNSLEYQQIQQCIESIQKHKTSNSYGTVGHQNITLESFLSALKDRFDNTDFHQQIVKPKIHVLGLMEASGLQFDHCWVAGFSSEEIPSKPSPNVFLPASIQAQYEMPRSNAVREYDYAEQLTKDLILNNNCIHFSFSKGDSECEVSPTLRKSHPEYQLQQVEDNDKETSAPAAFIAQQITNNLSPSSSLETLVSGNTSEIPENSIIPGGSGHLSLFQTNPYYAFLRYRLGIKPATLIDEGVNPADYGSILHDILNQIYKLCDSSEKLKLFLQSEQCNEDLSRLISESIDSILKGDKNKQAIVKQELQERLHGHLFEFLELEQSRPQDFKIFSLEQATKLHILNRELKIRIDRIDEIDGLHLVIDYKSGTTKHQSFLSSPPQEYQLPLYALSLSGESIRGVMYAELSAKATQYVGTASNEINVSGVYPNARVSPKTLGRPWEDNISQWQSDIEYTVQQITNGHCGYQIANMAKAAYWQDFDCTVRDHERNGAGINE